MISLLGTLLGFGTSIVPEVLGYFKQQQANKQELAMLEAKAKYAAQLSELRVKELDAQAEIEETKGLYEHDRSIDAGGFVNALTTAPSGSMPMFFIAFASVKGVMIYAMIENQNIDWVTAVESAWDDETQAIFSAIIAFWFGNRAMSKAHARVSSKNG